MKKSIRDIAKYIGMQNQYLAHAISEGRVIGEVIGSYHSSESWVDIDSVKKYIQWKLDNYVISRDEYTEAIMFLESL